MPNKTDVAAQNAGLSVPDYNKFLAYITEQANNAPDGSEINDKIFAATTVDEVLGGVAGEAIHAEDIIGVPLLITAVRFNASDVSNAIALPAYAVMECVTTDGTSKVVTCGGTTVMAQLYKLIVLDGFPQAVFIRRSAKPTRNGFYPMHLEGAKAAFEEGF